MQKNKVASGFIDRWLFAYLDKVPYPELNDNEIDKSITATWNEIIRNVLDIEYHGTSRVLKFSPKAKKIYTDWFKISVIRKILHLQHLPEWQQKWKDTAPDSHLYWRS